MSTPRDPDDDGVLDPSEPFDDLDAGILDRLDALLGRVDGPPPGFCDLMVFAVAAHGLEVELARLQEGEVAARSVEEVTRSLTFEADSLSILLRVGDIANERVRLDGWLAPPLRTTVELRSPAGGPNRRVESGEDGRFVLDGLRHGLVQLVIRRDAGQAPVVTPTFEL